MQFGGIRVAKILGIEIWLDYSWLIIFFLIFLSFTAGVVPSQFPELSWPASLATGTVTTLLFFVSVIAHELSHSLYAKRQGLHIKRITLFIFGGASELLDEPKTPRQEFAIAAVGPLTSIAIGVLFLLVWLIGNAIDFVPMVAVGAILSTVNIALAVFNLLPGFPLDGGRIFRSFAWKQTGSLERATRYAATGGRILGLLLIAGGITQILFAGLAGGLWLILIGFFLYQSAGLSYLRTMSQLILKGLRVRDLMRRDFMAVARNTRVRDLLRRYVRRRKKTSVVVEPDRRHRASVLDINRLPEQALDEPVSHFVPAKSYTLTPSQTVIKALDTMMSVGIPKLPVIEKGKLVGVLSADDIQTYITGKSKLNNQT